MFQEGVIVRFGAKRCAGHRCSAQNALGAAFE
jgi:hypothetical protein